MQSKVQLGKMPSELMMGYHTAHAQLKAHEDAANRSMAMARHPAGMSRQQHFHAAATAHMQHWSNADARMVGINAQVKKGASFGSRLPIEGLAEHISKAAYN